MVAEMIREKTKLTLQDLIDYFAVEVPKILKLKYQDTYRELVEMVIKKESTDDTFLPGDMSAWDRAEMAIPILKMNRLPDNEVFQKLQYKYHSLAALIILNHRKAAHAESDYFNTIDKQISQIYACLNAEEITFSEYENELIETAKTLGFWNG